MLKLLIVYMKLGLIEIEKAYLGTKSLDSSNAFLGIHRLIEGPTPVDDRFRLEALADNSVIGLALKGSAYDILQYSLDGDTWSDLTTSTSVTLNTGGKMFIRGHAFKDQTSGTDYNNLSITGNVAAKGNIMYLYDYNNPSGTTVAYARAFRKLFDTNCLGLTLAHELIMPATTLATHSYSAMFSKADNLTTAPALPATTLGANCYFYMFEQTSITSAPALQAASVPSSAYSYMFNNCASLTTAPELPATTLTSQCYSGMFNGCTSLTTAPAILPATILAEKCYLWMFAGCTSLTSAPALPATTLASRCYLNMFDGCTSLTTAPELSATTLSTHCYNSMFFNCSSLTTAPELPATTLALNCYKNIFNGCSSLNYIKCLATNISATDCTTNWVSRVSATGTFVKDSTMSSWTTGINGIPSGWTVQDA